ncbi:MAG: RNA 2',3'-cyclic phosphodiesterase [Pseudomonadota bacterium]
MSPQQDSLFDTIQAPLPRHRLFFALVPPDAVRERIAEVAASMRGQELLAARWVRPARYHLTLAFLGDHVTLGETLLASARAAGDAVASRIVPFAWRADRIDSFRGRKPPCVLRSGADDPHMLALRHALQGELARQALDGFMERSFVPHVTLAYAEYVLPAPVWLQQVVDWPVDAFELLHGEVGHHDYRPLGRWRLGN